MYEYLHNYSIIIFLQKISYHYTVCAITNYTTSRAGVTNCCQISYTPTEILFEINEITRFSIKKIGMETSKIT